MRHNQREDAVGFEISFKVRAAWIRAVANGQFYPLPPALRVAAW